MAGGVGGFDELLEAGLLEVLKDAKWHVAVEFSGSGQEAAWVGEGGAEGDA